MELLSAIALLIVLFARIASCKFCAGCLKMLLNKGTGNDILQKIAEDSMVSDKMIVGNDE